MFNNNTVRFSPIENMFSLTKNRMKDFTFKKKEQLTKKVLEIFFNISTKEFYGFFNKTLDNILKFWLYTKWKKLLNKKKEN